MTELDADSTTAQLRPYQTDCMYEYASRIEILPEIEIDYG